MGTAVQNKMLNDRNKSTKQREAVSKARKGIVFSEEHRKKLSEARKGMKVSMETRKKLSEIRKGSKGSNRKGGISTTNQIERERIEMKIWRLSVFERDKFTCQMPGCGQNGGNLEAHHIKKFSTHKDLRTKARNGITLCKKCHQKIKNKEQEFEHLFLLITNHGE